MSASRLESAWVSEISEETVERLSRVFRILASEPRVRILLYLSRDGELDVNELCKLLKQTQPAVSHHLAQMRLVGIIGYRRAGKHNYYSVRPDQFRELMKVLVHERGIEQPCDQFLECVFSQPENARCGSVD
jgi:ArsR family transcriptional regulator